MTTQAIQWYANRLKEKELGIKAGELTARQSELDESVRHNTEVERENQRHNMAYEEYQRQQLAEDQRHNLAVETETNRSNVTQEDINYEKNDVSTTNAWITAGGRIAASLIPRLLTSGGVAAAGKGIKALAKNRVASAAGKQAALFNSGGAPSSTANVTGPRMSEDEVWAQQVKAERAAERAAREQEAAQRATVRAAKKSFGDKVAAAGNSSVVGSITNMLVGSILPLPMLRIISDKYGGIWADVVGSYQGYDRMSESERMAVQNSGNYRDRMS